MSWPPVAINLRLARDAAAARQECAAFGMRESLFPRRSCIPALPSILLRLRWLMSYVKGKQCLLLHLYAIIICVVVVLQELLFLLLQLLHHLLAMVS